MQEKMFNNDKRKPQTISVQGVNTKDSDLCNGQATSHANKLQLPFMNNTVNLAYPHKSFLKGMTRECVQAVDGGRTNSLNPPCETNENTQKEQS